MLFTGTVADFAPYLLQVSRQGEKQAFIVADFDFFVFRRNMTGKAVKVELLLLFSQGLVC